jgi:hypothetical protein
MLCLKEKDVVAVQNQLRVLLSYFEVLIFQYCTGKRRMLPLLLE